MNKPIDDLEAVRIVADTLEPFEADVRARIVRWALEKLGDGVPHVGGAPPGPRHGAPPVSPPDPPGPTTDIKSFVNSKNPKSAVQLAAVVAYYCQFEADLSKKKDAIEKADLDDATRLSERPKLPRPEQVLVNAYHAGYLDRTGEKGRYKINAVGENLVAIALPGDSAGNAKKRKARGPRRKAKKKATKKAPVKNRSAKRTARNNKSK